MPGAARISNEGASATILLSKIKIEEHTKQKGAWI
jgi:hypothetical protein